jgi:hypothetical protein
LHIDGLKARIDACETIALGLLRVGLAFCRKLALGGDELLVLQPPFGATVHRLIGAKELASVRLSARRIGIRLSVVEGFLSRNTI